jgi:serine/threonine protein kinase
VAHFRLLSRLGVGGCGTVWKAHDTKLDRPVAIKIPRSGTLDSKEEERFLREARTAAQLSHPNIVSTYEVGHDGDVTYLACEFIRGVPLSSWLTAKKLTPEEAANLTVKLATALHFAHGQGVIHRDIKPANVMMDTEGEPRITDFGLAKREFGDESISVDGQVIGTPAYMSPEQARGDSFSADRRTDVYALGVLLFELLTHELPFRGNIEMLLHQIQYDSPPDPRSLNPGIPQDLATICLKCMEKAPGRRYASARTLAEDLQRYLNDEPILARRVSPLAHALRWCRRKPAAAGLLGVVCFLAIFGPGVAWRQTSLRKKAELAVEQRDAVLQRLSVGSQTLNSNDQADLRLQMRPLTDQLLQGAMAHTEQVLGTQKQDQTNRLDSGAMQLAAGLLAAQSGDAEAAFRWLQTAKDTLRTLQQEQPDNANIAAAVAHARSVIAQLHQLNGDLLKAAAELREATTILQDIVQQHPEELKHQRQLAETELRLSLVESQQGEGIAALKRIKQSMQRIDKLRNDWPTDPQQLYRAVCELIGSPPILIPDR